ncbi:MAG: PAS domain-containing protein, partial [Rhodospirillales bacterium]|nr:PAS domain-containing protein [Rhodospirillales bacterium]
MGVVVPESDVAPEIIESVRRWATVLRCTEPGSAEAESALFSFAREIQADRERIRQVADARFTTLYRFCPVGVVLVDPRGLVIAANPAFSRLVRAKDVRLFLGQPVADLAGNDHSRNVLSGATAQADGSEEQIEIAAAGDVVRVVMATFAALPGADGHRVVILEDVHELRMLQRTFQYQTLHDPLTGLPNGSHVRSKVEAMLADAPTGRSRCCCSTSTVQGGSA